MIINEYRVINNCTEKEYQVAQLYATAMASKNSTGGGEGVEVVKNEPYEKPGEKGQYTYKIYRLESRVPAIVRSLAPAGSLELHEEAWNAYPYCKTVLTNRWMKKDFSIVYETLHVDGSRGELENALKISDEDLKRRNVQIIDIAHDHIETKDYKQDQDPKLFKSEKTGRGPLTDPLWQQKCEPVMTCYKLVYIEFKWFGLQGKVESLIANSIKNLFTNFHRQLFCWTDKWFGLTIEDIRKMGQSPSTTAPRHDNASTRTLHSTSIHSNRQVSFFKRISQKMHPTRRFGRQNRTQAVINDTQPIAPSTRRNTTRVNRQGSSILLNSGSSTTSSVRRATQEATQAAAAVTGPPSLPGFIHYLQHIQDQDRNSTSSDSVRTHLPNYRIYGNEENETNNRSFLRGERNNSRTTLASSGASIVTSNSTRRMHILVIEYRQNTSSDNISTRTQSTTHRPSLLSRSFQRLGRPRSEVSTSSSTDTLQSMPLSMHTNASHTTSHPFSQEGQWIVYVLNGSHPPQPSLSFMDDNPTYEDLLLLTQMLGPARPSTTTQAAVDEAIPAVDWSDDTKKKLKDDQCLVCLDEFDLKQSVRILRCHHVFHKECVDRWLCEAHNSCPVCRRIPV